MANGDRFASQPDHEQQKDSIFASNMSPHIPIEKQEKFLALHERTEALK